MKKNSLRIRARIGLLRMKMGFNSAPSIRLPMVIKDLIFLGLLILSVTVGIQTGQPLCGVGVFLGVTVLSIVLRL